MTFCFNNNNNLSIFCYNNIYGNLTRSPGGEFLSAVVFGRIGIFDGGGFRRGGG